VDVGVLVGVTVGVGVLVGVGVATPPFAIVTYVMPVDVEAPDVSQAVT
jgi:hypothetical protein